MDVAILVTDSPGQTPGPIEGNILKEASLLTGEGRNTFDLALCYL